MTWRPSFSDGLLRKLLGEDGDTVFFGVLRAGLRARRHGGLLGRVQRQPGRVDRGEPQRDTLGRPEHATAAACRCCSATRRASAPPAFPTRAAVSAGADAHRHGPHLQPESADPVLADLGRRHPPQADARHRHRGPLRRHAPPAGLGRRSISTRADITANGFINEFRQAQAQPAGEHRGGPRQHVRLHRRWPGTGAAADLPRVLHRHAEPRRRATRRATPAARGPTRTSPIRWRSSTRTRSRRRAPTPTPASTATPTRRANAVAAGLPRNFFRLNPDVADGEHREQHGLHRATTRLQMELTKRLSHGFLMQGSYVVRQLLHLVALLAEGAADQDAADRRPRRASRTR